MKALEVCVDNVMSAVNAKVGGASRVELCSSLAEGGLTPSLGMLKQVKSMLGPTFPVFVLVRPRGGDFLYSSDEVEIMKEDIRCMSQAGADGFVIGCLDENGNVDSDKCRQLMTQAPSGTSFTFHRAFDMARDPEAALEAICDLGCTRLLTSGQEASAIKGAEALKRWNLKFGHRITIMAGGGINSDNLNNLVLVSGLKEFHASARTKINSEMKFQNPRCSMGSKSQEFELLVTNVEEVKKLVALIKK